jgi:hypothetical protein
MNESRTPQLETGVLLRSLTLFPFPFLADLHGLGLRRLRSTLCLRLRLRLRRLHAPPIHSWQTREREMRRSPNTAASRT